MARTKTPSTRPARIAAKRRIVAKAGPKAVGKQRATKTTAMQSKELRELESRLKTVAERIKVKKRLTVNVPLPLYSEIVGLCEQYDLNTNALLAFFARFGVAYVQTYGFPNEHEGQLMLNRLPLSNEVSYSDRLKFERYMRKYEPFDPDDPTRANIEEAVEEATERLAAGGRTFRGLLPASMRAHEQAMEGRRTVLNIADEVATEVATDE
jgi:hypothetical protein